MSPLPKPPSPDALDTLSVEERMRRALGLTGDRNGQSSPPRTERSQAGPPGRVAGRSSDKPRHRFVQDGAVPVTVVSRSRPDDADGWSENRAAIEAALQDERAARAKTERALQEALATVRDLQTKLGHAELAHREALGAARAEVDTLRAEHQEQELCRTQDLAAERAARTTAEAALVEMANARGQGARTQRPALAVEPATKTPNTSPMPAARAAAKRTRKAVTESGRREPQPVKWWLKSAMKRWP